VIALKPAGKRPIPIKSWTPSPAVTYRMCWASKAAFARASRTVSAVRNTVTSWSFKRLYMLPNGPRLSCGAELERSQIEDYLRERGAVSFRRWLGSTGAATS